MATSFSKRDSRYWYQKIFKQSQANGQVDANWSMRVAIGGKRCQLSLDTGNKQTAAERAATVYSTAKDSGWDAAVKQFGSRKPITPALVTVATIGDAVQVLNEKVLHLSATTRARYRRALLKIAGDIGGVVRSNHIVSGAPVGRRAVDALPITILTSESLREWQRNSLKGITNPDAIEARKNYMNSLVLAASSFWGKGIRVHMDDAGVELGQNPFAGVDLFRIRSKKYRSSIDAAALLKDARETLEHAVMKVVCLALQTGLRRGELDRLRWADLDFENRRLHVCSTADGATKTAASARTLDIGPSLLSQLQEWRAASPDAMYVLGESRPTMSRYVGFYRCAPEMKSAIQWLRSRGVGGSQPLHTMRKEFGSLINQKFGLAACAESLGHTSVVISARLYVSMKERIELNISL